MSLFRRCSRRQQRKCAYAACAALWLVHSAMRCAALPHALRLASVPHAAPPRLALTRYVLAGLDIRSSCARGEDWTGHRPQHGRRQTHGSSREHAPILHASQITAIPGPALTVHPCDCSTACTLRHIPQVALLGTGTQHPTDPADATHRSSSARAQRSECSDGILQHHRSGAHDSARRLQVPCLPLCGVANMMLCAVACCACVR